ncbi:hypothetical protein BGZ96_004154 [Linnemannia gamsii]|uniref:Uncharacterized protein n=1 Tax=Linnemannia gamsii TaxID=64522 RepID=A0ABQ7K789_9FUNG|nr:hypothetical protein BGZ96_004154 [Linnemannia gamsii]
MQSTQRVEKTNHLLKLFDLNSNASLSTVFEATVSKIQAEAHFESKHTIDAAGKLTFIRATERGLENGIVKDMFSGIMMENSVKLGSYAQYKMWREMAKSFIYDTREGRCMSSLSGMVACMDTGSISHVFKTLNRAIDGQPEFVAVFENDEYFCTCLLHQNSGDCLTRTQLEPESLPAPLSLCRVVQQRSVDSWYS